MSNYELSQKLKGIIYKRLKMNNRYLDWNKPEDLKILTQYLQAENIAVGTSDTVIGLLASLNKENFEQLNAIKGRSEKPYIILLASRDQLCKFTNRKVEGDFERLINTIWPGPVTILVPAATELPSYLRSKNNTVAIRIPDHAGLRFLAEKLGGVFSTSANLTGAPVPDRLTDVDVTILNSSAYVVGDRGPDAYCPSTPSTILDCSGDGITLIRQGARSVHDIESQSQVRIT